MSVARSDDTPSALAILLVARHPYGGRPPLGDWQMARALGRHHRVLYVEPPAVVRSWQGWRTRYPELRTTSDGVTVMRPTALPGATRRRTAWLSDAWLSRQIQAESVRLFGTAKPVLLCFDPLRGTLNGVNRAFTVYWRRDRLADLAISRRREFLEVRDARLLAASDLVSCTARTLVREAESLTRGAVRYIPNGCEAEHFRAPRERPPRFPPTEPVIGFVGGAFWRLDRGLIDHAAAARPNWTFLFVGDDRSSISSRPNVRQLGYVDYDQIPAYMQHVDVGIIPYDLDLPFNLGSFPIKAYEYLAAGVPVVSTAMPALTSLEPFVRLASDPDDFVGHIETALAQGPGHDACRRLAAENTWSDRAEQLTSEIRQLLAATPS